MDDQRRPTGGWRAGNVVIVLASPLLLVLILILLWTPVARHYRVVVAVPDEAVIDADRRMPSDQVLTEVANASMMTDHPLSGMAAVDAAERILRGELVLPSLPVISIDVGFSPHDLEKGVPVQQLWMASLIVPDLLLRAYEHRKDPRYFQAAYGYVESFCGYEPRALVPKGWLWNAHATSNRVAVLARFWKFARTAGKQDSHMARCVHEQASRMGALLRKPELFVASTNHGVMQNVALIQLSIAFPALSESRQYRSVALERLRQQLPFYISREGPVLEHSAGYHFHGVVLTGFLIKLLQLADVQPPSELISANRAAFEFLTSLQRPDRSLPLIGNTYRYQWHLPAMAGVDDEERGNLLRSRNELQQLYPVSGYAVWFQGGAQTVIPWGYFAGHGHRRAQEMSLLVWADNTDWSTNTGYWPGDDQAGIDISTGWDGGNAPHVLGESAQETRQTRLIGYVQNYDLRVLDLERKVRNGPLLRRQIVMVGSTIWVVIDTYRDQDKRPLRVLWTAAPEVETAESGKLHYELRRDGGSVGMTLSIQGSSDVTGHLLRGSKDPFGGWVAHDRRADPAPAVDARLGSPAGWMAAVLQMHSVNGPAADKASVTRFSTPDDWDLEIEQAAGKSILHRRGQTLILDKSIGQTASSSIPMALQQAPDVGPEQTWIADALDAIRSKYPSVQLFEDDRAKVSNLLMATWAAMFALGWYICRRWRPVDRALWAAVHVILLGGASWMLFVWLKS